MLFSDAVALFPMFGLLLLNQVHMSPRDSGNSRYALFFEVSPYQCVDAWFGPPVLEPECRIIAADPADPALRVTGGAAGSSRQTSG